MSSSHQTCSEILFERFLSDHTIPYEPIPVAGERRPDYVIGSGTPWGPVIFEVKELTKDENFKRYPLGVSERIIGEHIRRKIAESKKQIKYGAKAAVPSILLIYNSLDTVFHMFGTEDHDFRAAMHGDWTLRIDGSASNVIASGYGKNRSFDKGRNTSFSALAHLMPIGTMMTIRIFPNGHAKFPLPAGLPECFEIVGDK